LREKRVLKNVINVIETKITRMGLLDFLRAKSFDELMDEYEKSYADPKRRFKILQEARKVAKTPEQELILVTTWNEFREQYGP